MHSLLHRSVAQLVEHLTLNQGVEGSSPSGPTEISPNPMGFFYVQSESDNRDFQYFVKCGFDELGRFFYNFTLIKDLCNFGKSILVQCNFSATLFFVQNSMFQSVVCAIDFNLDGCVMASI